MTNDRYTMIPLASVLEPKDERKAWMNYFWAISPNDEIYILKDVIPQCSKIETIAKRLAPEGSVVKFIPILYLFESTRYYADGIVDVTYTA